MISYVLEDPICRKFKKRQNKAVVVEIRLMDASQVGRVTGGEVRGSFLGRAKAVRAQVMVTWCMPLSEFMVCST